jgi:hypothetical protein
MDAKRVKDAVEVLNWLATQIHTMPDRERATIESGVFLALSSICLGDYVNQVAAGAEPYEALKTAADAMTEYRKQMLQSWQPLVAEATA